MMIKYFLIYICLFYLFDSKKLGILFSDFETLHCKAGAMGSVGVVTPPKNL